MYKSLLDLQGIVPAYETVGAVGCKYMFCSEIRRQKLSKWNSI